jgi:hypothetical protein
VRVEAGYLMAFDLEFERAMDFFLKCKTFQPAELFAFFPNYTRKWLRCVGLVCVVKLRKPPETHQEDEWER